MSERVREILASVTSLATPLEKLSDTADLYDAGLTSFASVQLMLALESTYDIEFPEHMLTRKTFASISAIDAALAEITKVGA